MMSDIIEIFRNIDVSTYPDFYSLETSLKRGLWVLLVGKDKAGIKRLTSEQVAMIIREIMEISVNSRSIANSFNKAGKKIHIFRQDGIYYEIMKPGKDHLFSQVREGSIQISYFEPDKHFTSKRLLTKNILDNIGSDLSIVDPYCGVRTLDILSNLRNNNVKFLTRIENLREKEKEQFLRELKDFKAEHSHIEFKNYPNVDIHDRYILSSDGLIILGHSIKDLGSKESFAIVLNKGLNKNIVDALIENFNRRWKQATMA